jgi:hypothetical protein
VVARTAPRGAGASSLRGRFEAADTTPKSDCADRPLRVRADIVARSPRLRACAPLRPRAAGCVKPASIPRHHNRSLPFMPTQVSIITPTANREHLLPAIARCVQRQRVKWEWLILDDSATPSAYLQTLAASDKRVRYFHSPTRMSIGAKRNFLIGESRAPVIAHFDDDDHYAPHYLAHMLGTMQENHADLIKLSGFFMYAPHTQFFGYMDLNAKIGLHYELGGRTVSHLEFHEKMQIGADFILFYGFSYVYDRARAADFAFDDVDLYEDESFIRRVVSAGRKVIAVDDPQASCLHLVHPASTSRCFSRHSIPPFLLPTVFPCYEGYVAR